MGSFKIFLYVSVPCLVCRLVDVLQRAWDLRNGGIRNVTSGRLPNERGRSGEWLEQNSVLLTTRIHTEGAVTRKSHREPGCRVSVAQGITRVFYSWGLICVANTFISHNSLSAELV